MKSRPGCDSRDVCPVIRSTLLRESCRLDRKREESKRKREEKDRKREIGNIVLLSSHDGRGIRLSHFKAYPAFRPILPAKIAPLSYPSTACTVINRGDERRNCLSTRSFSRDIPKRHVQDFPPLESTFNRIEYFVFISRQCRSFRSSAVSIISFKSFHSICFWELCLINRLMSTVGYWFLFLLRQFFAFFRYLYVDFDFDFRS